MRCQVKLRCHNIADKFKATWSADGWNNTECRMKYAELSGRGKWKVSMSWCGCCDYIKTVWMVRVSNFMFRHSFTKPQRPQLWRKVWLRAKFHLKSIQTNWNQLTTTTFTKYSLFSDTRLPSNFFNFFYRVVLPQHMGR